MNKKLKIALLIMLSLMMIGVIYYSIAVQTSFDKGRTEYLGGAYVSSVTIDSQGRPWVLEDDNRGSFVLKVLERGSWKTYSPKDPGFPTDIKPPLVFDLDSNLWMPTYESGLVMYDGRNWETFTTKNSGLVADDKISGLAVDNQGRIWIYFFHMPCCGSNNSPGVTVYDESIWKTYNTGNSELPSNEVYSVAFDANNRAWFGTNKGLSIFDGEQWVTYTPQNSEIASATIWSIAFDRDNNLAWIGLSGKNNLIGSSGDNNGVNRFDGEKWEYYSAEKMGFFGDRIRTDIYNVFVDQSGRIWVWDGTCISDCTLRIFDDGIWTGFDEADIPPNFNDITMDEQGNIWISTFDGLIKLDKDYRIPSKKQHQVLRVYKVTIFLMASLIVVTLIDIKRHYRIILLVTASIILLPVFVFVGIVAGMGLGMGYTDFPIIEAGLGGIVGGVFAITILILIWKKFLPRN